MPVGAAGALSAAFNTPVAAVLFALEEIIGDMNAALLGSTVVASVAAVIVERSILGNEPLFHVPTYRLVHPAELLAYAALGIIGGIVSLMFCKALLALRGVFLRLPPSTKCLQPAIGGLVIGAVLLYSPAIMGVGYEYVDQALNGGLLLKTMAMLCLLKLGATIVSYASGNAGGIFAPSLYIGAMAGGAVGMLVHRIAPFPTGESRRLRAGRHGHAVRRHHSRADDVGVHDLRDHAGLSDPRAADGREHAELHDLEALPAGTGVSRAAAAGWRAPAVARDRRSRVSGPTARHVMQTDVSFMSPGSVGRRTRGSGLPHTTHRRIWSARRDRLLGIVKRAQLEACKSGRARRPIQCRTVVTDAFVHAHPDHPIDVVLERLAESEGLLPVVSRRKLAGWKASSLPRAF